MTQRNYMLSLFRIIAALGVFTGHFCGIGIASKFSLDFLAILRNGVAGKTVLAYFFEGDLSVIFFFIVGGFLISFNFLKRQVQQQEVKIIIIRKSLNLLVPTFVVILFSAFVYYILLRLNVSDYFSTEEILFDVQKVLISGGIPYYSYQLWFIHHMFKGYIIGYSLLLITSDSKILRFILIMLLIVNYIIIGNIDISLIFIGMLFGDICFEFEENVMSHRMEVCLLIATLILCPLVYNEHQILPFTKVACGMLMGLLVLMVVKIKETEFHIFSPLGAKIILLLDSINYSFYLVHALILFFVGILYNEVLKLGILDDGLMLLVIFYCLSLIVTCLISIAVNKLLLLINNNTENLIRHYFIW